MNITWKLKAFNELSLKELYEIMAVRQEVFVIEQDCPYLDADGKDYQSYHLSGYIDNDIAAYMRIVEPGISYKEPSLGRIVTSNKHRGTGLGKQLMTEGIKQTFAVFGEVPIRISAQCYLNDFYQSFNFEPVGEEYLEDDIPHIEMLRKI